MEPTTLDQALIQIIQQTSGAVQEGVAFISTQLPDVIQQLLLWHAVKSALWAILSVCFFLACSSILWRLLREYDAELQDGPPKPIVWSVLMIVPTIFSGALFDLAWLQIWLAPKIFLIEYAANLAR